MFHVAWQEAGSEQGRQGQDACDYKCTITCAFCDCRKHYEEECYHKQRLSAKLTSDNSPNEGQTTKGNGNKGKGKSKGRGKGQDPSR